MRTTANQAILAHHLRCTGDVDPRPVTLALQDLRADLARTIVPCDGLQTHVHIEVSSDLAPEQYRIDVADAFHIAAGDSLGAALGIYALSTTLLGVDPMWYWRDVQPPAREPFAVAPRQILAPAPAFRFRGWFVNDEDLLTDFHPPTGQRDIDYPFYRNVVNLDLIDRVFESLLRCGGNLIIPASFIDILNPPERAVIERAVQRGLYVSQHHVEPLGVSHFAFESYHKRRAERHAYLYSKDPDRVRAVWAAHAKEWVRVAGDRVVWQMGLRGRGDAPVWTADAGIDRSTGAAFISRAIADQANIIRQFDPRPDPPATVTLFLEGAELMARGLLTFPPGTTIVFSDNGMTQQLQADFETCPRLDEHAYGVYYHVAFWACGPHLCQGAHPARIADALQRLFQRGDAQYAIANVSNLREHALGAQAFVECATHGPAHRPDWPEPIVRLLDAYDACFVQRSDGSLVQDGDCNEAVRQFVERPDWLKGPPQLFGWTSPDALGEGAKAFDAFASLASEELMNVAPAQRPFVETHFIAMGRSMAHQYRALAFLLRDRFGDAADAVQSSIEARAPLARGRWADWYRGENKCHWPVLVGKLRQCGT
jgi:hypothetical protein